MDTTKIETTRNDYIEAAGGESEAIEFEERCLSIGPAFMPPCAVAVLEGNDPTPAYWDWLISQLEGESMDTTEFAGWTFDECGTDEGAYYSTDENVRYCVATGITEANSWDDESSDVRWARVMHAEDFVATEHLYEGEDAIEDAMRKAMDLSSESED